MKKSIEHFQVKGFSQTSIQEIVDSLGVTKGTFYYYFTSKEELLMDINIRYIDDILDQQLAIVENDAKDAKTKVMDIITMLIVSIDKIGDSAKIFFREMRNLNHDHLELIIRKRKEFYLNLQHVVEEGMEKGELRSDLRADIVTFGILGICNWSHHWFRADGEIPDVGVAKIFAEMILNGIKI